MNPFAKPINLTNVNRSIAILGFAKSCSQYNAKLAYLLANALVIRDFELLLGNTQGTFKYAITGARLAGGLVNLVLTPDLNKVNKTISHPSLLVKNSDTKHQLIAQRCRTGIVIGGGLGTLKLINELLKQNKKVIALANTGGVVMRELPSKVVVCSTIDDVLQRIEFAGQ